MNILTDSESVLRQVRCAISDAGLWHVPGAPSEERGHLISPVPFELTVSQHDTIIRLGDALLAFYVAANDLYLRSGFDWVREYLDFGKGEELLRHARMKYQKRALPGVIRPDILITDDGMMITELDSVPGGIGHLDCLSAAYVQAGFDLVGSGRGMRDGFASMLRSASGRPDPLCAIVVSDESIDYLQEMIYLASELRGTGLAAHTARPRDLTFTEEGLFIEVEGSRLRVDVLYRFFELFDLLNIPKAELISYSARKKLVLVTPPYKPFLEEKMLLALLCSESLHSYWVGALGTDNYDLLKRCASPTYILDNRPVPPHAEVSGFRWRGAPIRDWREVCQGTQRDRRLVMKPSGFSSLAWGARGVKVGHDLSEQEWTSAVREVLTGFEKTPYVLQPFSDTALIGVKYYAQEPEGPSTIREMSARIRLCPYYFVAEGAAKLGGVLATACPKDKKLVHGMADAVMMPCGMVKG